MPVVEFFCCPVTGRSLRRQLLGMATHGALHLRPNGTGNYLFWSGDGFDRARTPDFALKRFARPRHVGGDVWLLCALPKGEYLIDERGHNRELFRVLPTAPIPASEPVVMPGAPVAVSVLHESEKRRPLIFLERPKAPDELPVHRPGRR
jgi:hypothetical protein